MDKGLEFSLLLFLLYYFVHLNDDSIFEKSCCIKEVVSHEKLIDGGSYIEIIPEFH